MGKDVIVACDFATKKQVMDFLDLFKEEFLDKYGRDVYERAF